MIARAALAVFAVAVVSALASIVDLSVFDQLAQLLDKATGNVAGVH